MRRFACLISTAALCLPVAGHAAMLRPFSRIDTASVHLADLFEALGSAPDRVLGAAPAPGTRIVVGAPQLAAIARDYGVDWRPTTGTEQAVLERHGETLSPSLVARVLRRSLSDAGAPADFDVAMPDMQPLTVTAGSAVSPEIADLSYDAQTQRFTALIAVSAPDMPGVQLRVSGQVVPMVKVAVAARRLTQGMVLGEGDIQHARVRLAGLRNATPLTPEEALGLSVRHSLAIGQPLSTADLMRPPLVLRGAVIRMTLSSEGITLSAQGLAIEAGALGDRIRVENPVSHAVVEAEVVGDGEVRVAPRPATIALVATQ